MNRKQQQQQHETKSTTTVRRTRVNKVKRTQRNGRSNGVSVSNLTRSDVSTVWRMPSIPLFPPRTKVMMLPYYEAVQVSGGGVANYIFSANGLYDPNITGTGNQPAGFDQMMVFYNHYTVLRSKATCVIHNQSTTNYMDAALAVRADNVAVTDYQLIMQSGDTVATKFSTSPNTGSLKQLSIGVDLAKFEGKDDIFDSDEMRGTIAANPTEGTFYHISVWNSEAVVTTTAWCELRIEYYAVFSEPRVIAASLFKDLHKQIRRQEQIVTLPFPSPSPHR